MTDLEYNQQVKTVAEVNQRNTESVKRTLSDYELKFMEMSSRIDSLQNAIGTLLNRLNSLEQQLLIVKAKTMGHGPSA